MTNLDARYGRRTRRGGVVGIVVAAAVLVGLAVWWFVWAHPIDTGPTLAWEDLGFSGITNTQVDVASQVTIDPGNAAECAIEAIDESHGIVGWKVVDLPASDDRIRTIQTSVLTTQHPVTGDVHDCWLVTP